MSDVRELIDKLQSPKADERYGACEELRVLGSIPAEALAALRLASHDPDPWVADAAIRALAAHGEAPSRPASERENQKTGNADAPEPEGPDPEVQALAAMDDREGLFRLMQDEPQVTPGLDAAEALARLGDLRGVEHLIGVLDGRSRYLSAYARESLRRLNHPRGNRVSQGLDSSDKDEADVAAEILNGLNDPQGNDALRLHRRETPPIMNPPKPDDQVEAEDTPSQPLSPGDVWAAYREKQDALEAEFSASAQVTTDQGPASHPESIEETFSRVRTRATKFGAAAGGTGVILGLLAAYFVLLYVPQAMTTETFYFAFIGMGLVCSPYPLIGAAAGAIAARRVVKRDFNLEDEQPAFGRAIGAAAIAGLVCGVLPYAILGLWYLGWTLVQPH